MANDLTIGVLGAARISPSALLQPALDTPGVRVTTIAARSRSRAKAQADEFSIEHVLDSYDDVLASDVDAIYIPLPINAHHDAALAESGGISTGKQGALRAALRSVCSLHKSYPTLPRFARSPRHSAHHSV